MTVRNFRRDTRELIHYITPDGITVVLHDPPSRSVMMYEGDGLPPLEYSTSRGPFQHGYSVLGAKEPEREINMAIRWNACGRDEYWALRHEFVNYLRPNRTDMNNPSPGILRRILSNGEIYDIDVYLVQGPLFVFPDQWDHFSFQESLRFIAYNPILYQPDNIVSTTEDFGQPITLTATITAPAHTVTLQKITPTGINATVYWGDGSTSTILNGNTGTTTHVYAAPDVYTIWITGASLITYIDLRDTDLTINSETLTQCTSLTSLRLDIGGTLNSADIVGLPLTYLYMGIAMAGAYTINSSDISAMALTFLYLNLPVAGTYTFNSAHIAARTTITSITVVFLFTSATVTIARADWDGFPACGTIRFEAGLTSAQVDNLLLGLYDGFPTKTVTNGTIDVLGQSNAAPTGVLHAECPPLDGNAAAFELVNDSCGVSTKHWASVTTA